jgi:hypothetical protein
LIDLVEYNLGRGPMLLGQHSSKDPMAAFVLVIQLTTNVLVEALDTQFKDMILKDRRGFHIVLP